MVIRKQIVIDWINRKEFPYYASIRVITLNPNITLRQLRRIAIIEGIRFERNQNLQKFEKFIGSEQDEILKKEEPLIDNVNVYIQKQFRSEVINFTLVER